MLLGLAGLLLVLWLLGFFVFHLGAVVHAAIVIAVIVAVVHFVRGRGARV
ncbi:MAG: hypothetical protein QOI10_4266 [Solirubrobacterales bacterium]|jgi:hypothetical protein|nr:hypothetical protein [Solirubrobacterales bacterium]